MNLLTELEQEKEVIEQKIHKYESDIATLESQGVYTGSRYFELKSDLSAHQNKLAQIEGRIVGLSSELEEAVEEAVSNSFDTITVDGTELPLALICSGEDEIALMSTYLRQLVSGLTEKHIAVKQSLENDVSRLEETVSELLEESTRLEAYEQEIAQLKLSLADAEAKRDAAVKQHEELKQENDKLIEDNKQLRDQLSGSAIKKGPATTAEFAEMINRIAQKRPAIYDLAFIDPIKKNRYRAKLAETDEQIEFGIFSLNSYRVLEGEELSRFRQEKAEREAEEAAKTPDLPQIDKEVIPFKEASHEDAHDKVRKHALYGEVAQEELGEVTRAEFEALKQEVIEIKSKIGYN